MEQYLPYAIGAGVIWLLNSLGVKLPPLPLGPLAPSNPVNPNLPIPTPPSPNAPVVPAVSPALASMQQWLFYVTTNPDVKVSEVDKLVLTQMAPMFNKVVDSVQPKG